MYQTISWQLLQCNGYHHWKRMQWTKFKSWTRPFAFHMALILLRKVWIQLFSFQLQYSRFEFFNLCAWTGWKLIPVITSNSYQLHSTHLWQTRATSSLSSFSSSEWTFLCLLWKRICVNHSSKFASLETEFYF